MKHRHLKNILKIKNIDIEQVAVDEETDEVTHKGKKIKTGFKSLLKKIAELEAVEEEVKDILYTKEGLAALKKLISDGADNEIKPKKEK